MTDPRKDIGSEADDERLLDALARLVQERDPVPAELMHAARESYTWRTVDAELAELVEDSLQSGGASLVRSSATAVRLLAFAAGDLRLDLEVLTDAGSRSLVGEVEPAGRVHVVVEHPEGALTEDSDELGRFVVTSVPEGLIRLRCEPLSGPPLVTPWLRM